MPSVCRRIAVLLALVCLGAALPASTVFAQGAGDQQYQDPFGGSGSGSSGSGSGSSGSGTSTTQSPTLSQKPQTSGGGSGSSSGGGSSTPSGSTGSGTAGTSAGAQAPAAAAGAGDLPNTGVDARLLLAAGAILLLTGIGLRLRTTPERF